MEITTTKRFDKQFKKQPEKIKRAFAERISVFVDDVHHPTLNTHKLSGNLKNLWSFNVSGDVRVVFDKSYANIIILEAIGSHSELYG